VTAPGPLRGPGKEAAYPPLAFLRLLSLPGRHPASTVLRMALHATALRLDALDPGTSAVPGSREGGQATACPRPSACARRPACPAMITTTEVSTVVGNPVPMCRQCQP
jgi:hypothetical protein